MVALDPLLQVLGDVMQGLVRQEPVFSGGRDGWRRMDDAEQGGHIANAVSGKDAAPAPEGVELGTSGTDPGAVEPAHVADLPRRTMSQRKPRFTVHLLLTRQSS